MLTTNQPYVLTSEQGAADWFSGSLARCVAARRRAAVSTSAWWSVSRMILLSRRKCISRWS